MAAKLFFCHNLHRWQDFGPWSAKRIGKRIIILFAEVITMSKILLINGSPNEKGCTYTALAEIAATLHEQGVETEMIWLGKRCV